MNINLDLPAQFAIDSFPETCSHSKNHPCAETWIRIEENDSVLVYRQDSVAVTRVFEHACATAKAIAPEPVPKSRT